MTRFIARDEAQVSELLEHVSNQSRPRSTYLTYMAMSGILAAVALLTNSVPLLIGSMIVAPLMPPLAQFPIGLAVGQPQIALRGLAVALLGIATAVVFAILTTALLRAIGVLSADITLADWPLLEERVRPGWYSLPAAIAAGTAGMLAVTERRTDTLIGVVASVALVPAGGAAGVALVAGDFLRAAGGAVLLLVNLLVILGMGLVVLVLQGRGR